ncbi:YrvL family regulatory protein [Parageobacillus sp. G301]|jgi:Regulatory protein YrvL|uniref:YrvL family regulatory protein n=1 Tax=Parageobacillus sp. G301 TaxID=2998290 RepID=UPI0024964566|nr:YrvL family regulatory protein [Parageobacillus sp. G301]GLH62593.1 hypothetical protein PG301_04330 [Parageobacillus sp. G301]
MKEKNESFRNLNFRDKLVVITAISLLITFALVVVIGSFFFGIFGFFKLIGVEYDSTKSLILFICLLFLLGTITDILSKILHVIIPMLGLRKWALLIITGLIDIFFSWITIYTVDELMHSITMPIMAELLFAFLLFMVEVALFREKPKSKSANKTSR